MQLITLHVIYLKFFCQTKTYWKIPILLVVNKIIGIRLTPKLFESIKSVCESKRCRPILRDQWGISLEKILHIKQRNIGEKLRSQAQYFTEIKSKTLILPEVSFLSMIRISDNTVNALRRSYWKYISLDFISLPFLDFLCHLKYRVKEHVSKSVKSFM